MMINSEGYSLKNKVLILSIFVLLYVLMTPLYATTISKQLILGEDIIDIEVYNAKAVNPAVKPVVALVLSGGGARGFAHIPVIEALEQAGIPIDMVLGTSMGSLVGGLYAAGYSPGDMRRLIASYDMVELFALSALPPLRTAPQALRRDRDNLFVLGFDSGGLGIAAGIIGDQRILHMLNDSLSRVAGITHFDDLAIPFRCIGTDLATGQRIIFSEGSLASAIRASISIPLVFTPYPLYDRLIVDGGLVDNMPAELARQMDADIVIAVDVNAVDYKIAAEELESLTDVLSQLIVILTKNTVVNQTKYTDLLITPQLDQHSILDFIAIDEIIVVGEKAVAERTDDINSLREKIERYRPLEVKDPNRYGPYFSLPDVMVGSVSHRSIGSYSQDNEGFNYDRFSDFIGKPLDSYRKKQLGRLFEDMRSSEGYATVSYDYTNVYRGKSDAVWGTLEIQTREFGPKQSSLSAGISGAVSYAIIPNENNKLRILPDISIGYANRNFFDPSLTLEVWLKNSDATTFSTQLRYALSHKASFGAEIGYVTGGIHPLNLRYTLNSVDERDRMFTSELFFDYRVNTRHMMKIGADFDYIWYGEQLIGKEAFIPNFRFDGVYTTIPYGFFSKKGFRVDYSLIAEVLPDLPLRLGYRMEGRLQKVFQLGMHDALWFDIHAGTSHLSYPRKAVYFDYGGSRGIPSYPALTLVDDMLLARVKHLHWFSQSQPSLVLQTMFTVSSRGKMVTDVLSDSAPYRENLGLPFSSLSGMEYSASVALGLATANIDFLFGVAVDNHRNVAIFFEVL